MANDRPAFGDAVATGLEATVESLPDRWVNGFVKWVFATPLLVFALWAGWEAGEFAYQVAEEFLPATWAELPSVITPQVAVALVAGYLVYHALAQRVLRDVSRWVRSGGFH